MGAGVIVYDGTTGKKVSFLPTNATITLASCNSVLLVATTVGNTTVFSGYTLPHMTQTFSKTLHNPLSPFLSCTPQGPLIALDLTYGQTSTTYVVLDASSGATFASWTIPSPYCFQGNAGVVNGNPTACLLLWRFRPRYEQFDVDQQHSGGEQLHCRQRRLALLCPADLVGAVVGEWPQGHCHRRNREDHRHRCRSFQVRIGSQLRASWDGPPGTVYVLLCPLSRLVLLDRHVFLTMT